MSLTLSGFTQTKTKKETKPDISTFISTDESSRKDFHQIDHNSELNYMAACDGYRLALTGNIENWDYQSFDEKVNPVLKLAKSALPSISDLKSSHTITFNTNDLLEAMKLFAKNMKSKTEFQTKIETGKKKGQFITKTREILLPVIMRAYTDNHKVTFNLADTDMKATLDVDINLKYANMNIHMGFNPKYLMDAVKLFKNRKHDAITLRLMDKENYNVNPLCMYDKDIYVMILPVRTKTDIQED